MLLDCSWLSWPLVRSGLRIRLLPCLAAAATAVVPIVAASAVAEVNAGGRGYWLVCVTIAVLVVAKETAVVAAVVPETAVDCSVAVIAAQLPAALHPFVHRLPVMLLHQLPVLARVVP